MTESPHSSFSQETLDRLQRLRVSVVAFQNEVAPLPADERNNAHNEQFNQLRLEAKALLKEPDFDKTVPQAKTMDLVADHAQRVILPRLSAIAIFGVILALVGLGINSIILEDFVINSLACLISTGGMLLIIGAFAVLGAANLRKQRRLTNYGELYQHCNALRYEIYHALNMNIPKVTGRPAGDVPEIPSAVELKLDSLRKQANDWQQKLRTMEEQRLSLGAEVPMELTINLDFVQRELKRVEQEMDCLHGRVEVSTVTNEEKDALEQSS